MLDIKFIRENKDKVIAALKNRNLKLDLETLLKYDCNRRDAVSTLDELRAKKNAANQLRTK